MSFKQVIGQEKAVAILQNALIKNRLAHAYLFEGPPGVGKVFTATNFAKAINCLARPQGAADSCDECPSCRKIDSKNHIDVERLGLLKNKQEILIEQIRQLQDRINLKPYEARYKIFCIQDAELMNEEAESALLKTLEEPPLKSIIILTTSNPSMLFSTIVSRCQPVKFSALSINSLTDILASRFSLSPGAAHFLSHISQSGMMDISDYAKDNVLDEKNKIISVFYDFLKNPASEFPFINEEYKDVLWILTVLLWWHRDALILKETGDTAMISNKDRLNDLSACALRQTAPQLGRAISSILNTIQLVSQTNVNTKLALTVMATDVLSACPPISRAGRSEVKNV